MIIEEGSSWVIHIVPGFIVLIDVDKIVTDPAGEQVAICSAAVWLELTEDEAGFVTAAEIGARAYNGARVMPTGYRCALSAITQALPARVPASDASQKNEPS